MLLTFPKAFKRGPRESKKEKKIKSKERKQFIRELPIEKMVVESDSPYIGKTPASCMESIKMIAEIKGLQDDAVRSQTLKNTTEFFRIN